MRIPYRLREGRETCAAAGGVSRSGWATHTLRFASNIFQNDEK